MGLVVHTYHLSTQGVEAGRLEIQGQPQLHPILGQPQLLGESLSEKSKD